MQFPVPQFTDVEDKIIGPLTLKQFGIIFAAGVVIFLGYSATKSILVLIFLFMLFGVPALGLAFANINGRPVYNTIGYFIKFITSSKQLVFHKEASGPNALSQTNGPGMNKTEIVEQAEVLDPQANLKKVQQMLKETEGKEDQAVRDSRE